MLNAGTVIVMCKYQALHAATTSDKVMGLIFGCGMLGALNLFPALTPKAITNSHSFVARFWRCRFLVNIAFEATAFAPAN
jgi:hypothetical protein